MLTHPWILRRADPIRVARHDDRVCFPHQRIDQGLLVDTWTGQGDVLAGLRDDSLCGDVFNVCNGMNRAQEAVVNELTSTSSPLPPAPLYRLNMVVRSFKSSTSSELPEVPPANEIHP